MKTSLVICVLIAAAIAYAWIGSWGPFGPIRSKDVLSTMLTLHEPLPNGFEYDHGMELPNAPSLATIMNEKKQLRIWFISTFEDLSVDQVKKETEILNSIAKSREPLGSFNTPFDKTNSEKDVLIGRLKIAGHDIPYIVRTELVEGKLARSFGAVIVTPTHRLNIKARSPVSSFDLATVKSFLSNTIAKI